MHSEAFKRRLESNCYIGLKIFLIFCKKFLIACIKSLTAEIYKEIYRTIIKCRYIARILQYTTKRKKRKQTRVLINGSS